MKRVFLEYGHITIIQKLHVYYTTTHAYVDRSKHIQMMAAIKQHE